MSGANFVAQVDKELLKTVSLPIWFPYNLYVALHEFVDDLANAQARVTASGLPQEEKDELNNEILPELEALDLREADDFVPPYFANTAELYLKAGLLFKLLNDLEPSPELGVLADRYAPESQFNYSDEDSYKVPAALVDLLVDAKVQLESAIDLLNSPIV